MTDDMRPDDLASTPPELARALDGVRAPDTLRRAVAAAAADAEQRGRRARRPLAAALAGAAALLAVLALVLAGGGGDSGAAPGVRDVAHVALRPAAAPAPAARPGGELLTRSAGPIAFPTWTRAGWRAVGERTDVVAGRELRTVLYADMADPRRRVGYAIADGELPVAGGRLVEYHGARLRVLALDGAQVVTWNRDGRTCILAGRDVPLAKLVALASYAA